MPFVSCPITGKKIYKSQFQLDLVELIRAQQKYTAAIKFFRDDADDHQLMKSLMKKSNADVLWKNFCEKYEPKE